MSPSTSSDDRPCGPGSPPVRSGFSQRAETETFPAGLPVASSTVTHSATTGRPSASGDRSIRASPIKPYSRGYSGLVFSMRMAAVIRPWAEGGGGRDVWLLAKNIWSLVTHPVVYGAQPILLEVTA